MQTQLKRSDDRILAGVCGGIANYFGIDPVIVRLVFVLSVLFAGAPILLYPILWLIMPEERARAQIVHVIPDHPRPVEQWQFDPVTGEKIRR